jgi:hypothetical protein
MKNILPALMIASCVALSFAVIDYSKPATGANADKIQTGATIANVSDTAGTHKISWTITATGVDWIFLQKQTKPNFKDFVIVAQKSQTVPLNGVFRVTATTNATYRMLCRQNVNNHFYSNIITIP